MMFTITDFAIKRSGKLHGGSRSGLLTDAYLHNVHFEEHEPKMWDDLKGQFINHLDQVNADLRAAGLPDLNSRKN